MCLPCCFPDGPSRGFVFPQALCVEGHDVEEEREKQEAEERMNKLVADVAGIKQVRR